MMELREKSGFIFFSALFQHLHFSGTMFATGLEVFSHLIFFSLHTFHREWYPLDICAFRQWNLSVYLMGNIL